MDVQEQFADYESAALDAVRNAESAEALEQVRIEFLGKKKGRLKDLQSLLGKASPEERPELGKRFNEVKQRVEQAWGERKDGLERPPESVEGIDITLPGNPLVIGTRHPLTQTMDEFRLIMGRLGFAVADGPEIEDEFHNFEALNIPHDHPARDPLDNFYLETAQRFSGKPLLLRSQTSTVQIRVMEQTRPPVRIVSLGRVYRPDAVDATHSCMFHQMEGLMVDDSVTMADLKTVLRLFATAYLGDDVHVRFRPSFFPFTEPSVEVDMRWKDDWLEIGGAGMVDPNVLSAVGYDPEQYTGFAFGLGIERFCMRRHGIDDIRRLFDNDVRFLRQF
ncbi:MAG: phenylalanine--tRNA ligase subunit alpha [Planctomycetota bacterium]|nr:MAG: phenylalanine--tRNA ligase subunit alpha [Planctomycetota bacterium]REJ91976.1 MAG: phenylalanine--tRNA ligase subunit alpha [Planctomycetota bacterium]REK27237.1 MAG: phenylalanine--tRNA ligase subunit alpha [Planctomycetota bacterium]REK36741.1 MAG: phenylalanine--tRNA ligase subunit alpha [Planctomycetota bacterium]